MAGLHVRNIAAGFLVAGGCLLGACAHENSGHASTLPSAPAKVPAARPASISSADRPVARTGRRGRPDAGWMRRHEANVALAKQGDIDVYFEGDASVARWSRAGKAVWDREFAGWKAANFAVPGDKTQHVLWRLENGELDGVSPKVFVLMIGANNQGENSPAQTAAGVAAIVGQMRARDPNAKILLLGILPRKAPESASRKANDAVNALLAKLDDGKNVTYMDLGKKFTNNEGNLLPELYENSGTYLSEQGYQAWADAVKPVVARWLKR